MPLSRVAQPAGDAAGQARGEGGQRAHPFQRFLALGAQRKRLLASTEQRVVRVERGFHFVVTGQRRAIVVAELARRLALGHRPVGDAVLGDEPRRGLRDQRALLRRVGGGKAPLGAALLELAGGACHQKIWLRTSCALRVGDCGTMPSSRARGVFSLKKIVGQRARIVRAVSPR